MKKCCFIFFLFWGINSFGQTIGFHFNEEELKSRVELLDIFMARFNAEKDSQDNVIVSASSDLRVRQVAALFNKDFLYDQNHNLIASDSLKGLIYDFFDTISKYPQLKLRFGDENWFADIDVVGKYDGEKCHFFLCLRTEEVEEDSFRWALADAYGEIFEMSPMPKEGLFMMSPVDHELNFMGLSEMTDKYHAKQIVSNLHSGASIDPLSVFCAMVYERKLEIDYVSKIRYRFLQVPGFCFTVEFFEREGYNAGWLISGLQRMSEK